MADPMTPELITVCQSLGDRIAASLGERLGIPYEVGKVRFAGILRAETERILAPEQASGDELARRAQYTAGYFDDKLHELEQRALKADAELAQVLKNYEHLQGEALTLEGERDEARVEAGRLRSELEADRAVGHGAKHWHDTYQAAANAYDEFLGVILDLLPGAADEGMDAYDQIPRAIEKLTAEVDSTRRDAHRDRLAADGAIARIEQLTGERDHAERDVDQMRAERDEAREQVKRVRELHRPNGNGGCTNRCYTSGIAPQPYPCATIRALDGGEQRG